MIENLISEKQKKLLESLGEGNASVGMYRLVAEFEKKKDASIVANSSQHNHVIDMINSLDWSSINLDWSWKTATEILNDIGIESPSRGQTSCAGSLIRSLNGNSMRKSNGRQLLLVPGIPKQ